MPTEHRVNLLTARLHRAGANTSDLTCAARSSSPTLSSASLLVDSGHAFAWRPCKGACASVGRARLLS